MFSIVIPTKNEEKFLPFLLRDIKKQSLQPEKIIVADAHSTDKTRTIAQKFGCEIIDGGLPGVGRNRGAEIVTSKFIVFLDADVQIADEHFFKKVFQEMTERNIDIAGCDITPYDGTWLDRTMLETYNYYSRLTQKIIPHASMGIIIRTDIHKKIQGFDEKVLLAEDMDYVQRAAQLGTFGVLRTVSIATSNRRYAKDGRLAIISKFILAEWYMWLFGSIKTDIFKYRFGYENLDKKKKK